MYLGVQVRVWSMYAIVPRARAAIASAGSPVRGCIGAPNRIATSSRGRRTVRQ